ncbi:hypothetical protein EJP81_14660 [Rahnella aquatilis]|nr:hypothetical protein EJP79_14655 [Rahnella aquatilis]AZP47363.1 hypothetical protein EJP81_14660 [Rahnella aquatilis]
MSKKDGFDPFQKRGIQYFVHDKESMRVVYFGTGMDHIVNGEIVFFQREDGLFWFGRTFHNMYALILNEPIDSVLTGTSFVSREKHLLAMHEEDGSLDQRELPF